MTGAFDVQLADVKAIAVEHQPNGEAVITIHAGSRSVDELLKEARMVGLTVAVTRKAPQPPAPTPAVPPTPVKAAPPAVPSPASAPPKAPKEPTP